MDVSGGLDVTGGDAGPTRGAVAVVDGGDCEGCECDRCERVGTLDVSGGRTRWDGRCWVLRV